jgi:predicted CXXCH cytochrome family protein
MKMTVKILCNRLIFAILFVGVFVGLGACGKNSADNAIDFLFPGQRAIAEAKEKMEQKRVKDEAAKQEKGKLILPALVSHPTYIDGKCGICHEGAVVFTSPIAGNNWGGVFKKGGGSPGPLVLPAKEICQKCHQDLSVQRAEKNGLLLHTPAAKGECIKCHDPHQSRNPSILIENKEKLCGTCHKEGGAAAVAKCFKDHLESKPCLSCHNPHLGTNKALLTKAYKEEKHFVDNYLKQLTATPVSGDTKLPE